MLLTHLVFFNIFIVGFQALPYDNVYGPLYGEEWMLMVDNEGWPHYVNFTSFPNETESRTLQILGADAYFYLYTRQNPEESELLTIFENETVISQHFDPENELKVITHGWMTTGSSNWLLNIKDAYLRRSRINVITVDWREIAENPIYPISAYDTRYIGSRVARLLNSLTNSYGMRGTQMHLIGHSLGAQVMGFGGSLANENVSRITGLDPARPLFEFPDFGYTRRLDKTDADFVDIIHTCGGVYGYLYSKGDADFYPNDGSAMQPGCIGMQYVIESCSHGRAHEYFLESIENDGAFLSYACESWAKYQNGECYDNTTNLMGDHIDTSRRGDYYLTTNSEPKYSKT